MQHAHELEMLGQFLAVFLLITLGLNLKGLAHLLVLLDKLVLPVQCTD